MTEQEFFGTASTESRPPEYFEYSDEFIQKVSNIALTEPMYNGIHKLSESVQICVIMDSFIIGICEDGEWLYRSKMYESHVRNLLTK